MIGVQPAPFDPFELQDTVVGDVRDPYPVVNRLRRQHPVHRGPVPIGGVASVPMAVEQFSVYGYDEAAQVLIDDRHFSPSVYSEILGPVMGRSLLEMDPPDHLVHRRLVSHAFRAQVLTRWESELIQVVVDDLVDRFADRGGADLVREFTFAFPVQVIARILGLPMADYPRFQRWSIELLSVTTCWDRGIAASTALRTYFAGVLAERRRAPADDLISDLAAAEVDGRRLSDEEIFSTLLLLLPAGVETTYRSLGNLLFALLTHPDQLAAVRTDPELLDTAVEEGLRWEAPIMMVVRTAIEDTELAGIPIAAASRMGVCVGAANRDERRYPDPDRFDVSRQPRPHVTFGHGPHRCLGMHLARMETRLAVASLLRRLPGLRLVADDGDPHIHGFAFRSPTALPVRF